MCRIGGWWSLVSTLADKQYTHSQHSRELFVWGMQGLGADCVPSLWRLLWLSWYQGMQSLRLCLASFITVETMKGSQMWQCVYTNTENESYEERKLLILEDTKNTQSPSCWEPECRHYWVAAGMVSGVLLGMFPMQWYWFWIKRQWHILLSLARLVSIRMPDFKVKRGLAWQHSPKASHENLKINFGEENENYWAKHGSISELGRSVRP